LSKANNSTDKIDASVNHLNEILEFEGHTSAHFIGVSMGSLIAQYFSLSYPQKIKSMTALGGYNINSLNEDIGDSQKGVNFSLMIRAVFSMNAFRKKAAEITCKTEKGRALFYQSSKNYTRKSFMVMQGLQNIIKDRNFKELPYSTLILTSEFDIDLAKNEAKKWHTEINSSKFIIIKGAGHCANIDKPLKFNTLVKDFIDSNNY